MTYYTIRMEHQRNSNAAMFFIIPKAKTNDDVIHNTMRYWECLKAAKAGHNIAIKVE